MTMTDLHPDAPDWPCRTEPRDGLPDRLVSALYVLLRDHVHPGDLEQLLCELIRSVPIWRDTAFSNPHLEAMARAHASFLLEDMRIYPFADGDVLVIGPQCFITVTDGKGVPVINYRGENFVPQEGATALADDDSSEKPANCPTCGSPDPELLYPVPQVKGRVQPCSDPWHSSDVPPVRLPTNADLRRECAVEMFLEAARAHRPESNYQADIEYLDEAVLDFADRWKAAGDDSPDTHGVIELVGGDIAWNGKVYTAPRSGQGGRTPPMVVAAASVPAEALVAFIAQEMEHWDFGIELKGGRNTVTLRAEHRTFTVTVEEG